MDNLNLTKEERAKLALAKDVFPMGTTFNQAEKFKVGGEEPERHIYVKIPEGTQMPTEAQVRSAITLEENSKVNKRNALKLKAQTLFTKLGINKKDFIDLVKLINEFNKIKDDL